MALAALKVEGVSKLSDKCKDRTPKDTFSYIKAKQSRGASTNPIVSVRGRAARMHATHKAHDTPAHVKNIPASRFCQGVGLVVTCIWGMKDNSSPRSRAVTSPTAALLLEDTRCVFAASLGIQNNSARVGRESTIEAKSQAKRSVLAL